MKSLWTVMALALMALPVATGCRGNEGCVPVSRAVSGEPRKSYDEFTRVTWLTSWFLLTPDSEWERLRREPDQPIRWSVEMWLRGASNVPYIDLTLRALCSHRPPDAEEPGCVNCDNACNANNGRVEFLADGLPVPLPKGRYERVPIGAPEQGGPKTWGSTITLRLSPQALAPLAQAQNVRFRLCESLTVTMRPGELANLQAYLRQHRTIAPPEPPAAPRPAPRPAGGPVQASLMGWRPVAGG